MRAFLCRRDAQGTERWWLEVIGKGNKPRLVPATDELIAELPRDRRARAGHCINFGHSSLSMTSGYLHSEEDARHEARRRCIGSGGSARISLCPA
ncbi:hypothetical protein AWV79_22475 [Cupriavidus sp. UYMMa02A]|nr:hypothetical protein AWV79_22475 [Cupriavidus sp. UYMMa02A]